MCIECGQHPYDDNRIIDEILMKMVSKKIPVLPVHESLIAPAEHEGTLRQVMTEAYQRIMGKDFLPVTKQVTAKTRLTD
jgi:hypothetical protein